MGLGNGGKLCGLLGKGAAPGDKPPLPLPRAPSPRSDRSGDLSPSAIPRARAGRGREQEERGGLLQTDGVVCIVVSEMQASRDRSVSCGTPFGGVWHRAHEEAA